MTIEPDTRQSRSDLAGTLRKLRKAAGLSGERLAVRCAMSQSKISRIESGRALPTVLDVDRILTALEVPGEIATELLALARRANVEHTSWRSVAEMGLWRKQAELKSVAEHSKEVRHFLPAIPSGLLHVPEYARAALSAKVCSDPVRDVEKAVKARLDRQAVLDDPSRSFVFLMTEQAVRWKRASRNVMARQCDHMVELSERPNIDIAVVPHSAEVPGAPMNSYVIYDDRLVIAELFSGEVALRDPRDVRYHLDLFDFFLEHALTGSRSTAFLLSVRDDFM
ncbi:MAG: helix-turn-helix domain-containing protein [Pseudonocardiaceae bacterium]